ncbi:MAG: response regulator [Gammaproteobacteria bacterium]|nr:response regulator [Gammaproteobacteria bacterium]
MPEILLVDDDEGTRSLFSEIAALAGYQIHTASSGAEFFQLYAQRQPDLLILDLVMPNMDGLELMRKLLALDCQLPLLVISGYDYINEDGLELLSHGLNFKGFIKKPFNVVELRKLLTQVIEHPEPAT